MSAISQSWLYKGQRSSTIIMAWQKNNFLTNRSFLDSSDLKKH